MWRFVYLRAALSPSCYRSGVGWLLVTGESPDDRTGGADFVGCPRTDSRERSWRLV